MSYPEPDWDLVDAVSDALDDTLRTPSALGRRCGRDTTDVHTALRWLVRNDYAVPAGNGAWRKYRARTAGDPLNEKS